MRDSTQLRTGPENAADLAHRQPKLIEQPISALGMDALLNDRAATALLKLVKVGVIIQGRLFFQCSVYFKVGVTNQTLSAF